jgi:hypothetical protein
MKLNFAILGGPSGGAGADVGEPITHMPGAGAFPINGEKPMATSAADAESIDLPASGRSAQNCADVSAAPLTAGQEQAVRDWCRAIGETDQSLVGDVLAYCQRDKDARAYFVARAQEPPKIDREYVEERAGILEFEAGYPRAQAERMAVLDTGAVLCRACAHFHKPGHSDGFCHEDARPDLPHAYDKEHPLRQLPADLGESCPAFRLAAWMGQ